MTINTDIGKHHGLIIQRTENHVIQPQEVVITPTFQLACDILEALYDYYVKTGTVTYERGRHFAVQMTCYEDGLFAAGHHWNSDKNCAGMPRTRLNQPDFIILSGKD